MALTVLYKQQCIAFTGHAVPGAAPLLQDIYIARAEGELQLEEELFYLLLKIYKTPKLLNELTRLSQQQATHATA
jgi:hypothetical protein